MDISAFEAKLKCLVNEVIDNPPVKSDKSILCVSQARCSKADSLEDLLAHLSIVVKYLLFDVEATKRENRYLREVLDSRNE